MNFSCLNCETAYTTNNPPLKLRNCYHRLCQNCLVSNQLCPIDGSLIDCKQSGRFLDLDVFPIDGQMLAKALEHFQKDHKNSQRETPIQKLKPRHRTSTDYEPAANKSKENSRVYTKQPTEQISKDNSYEQFQECLLHSKPADLVCLDDQALICANCALFGSHKGHSIETEESFLKKLSFIYEQAKPIYHKLKAKKDGQLSRHTFQGLCKEKAISKRNQMTKEVKDRFVLITKQLKIVEKECLDQIQRVYRENIDRLKDVTVYSSQFDSESKNWLKSVESVENLTKKETRTLSEHLFEGVKFLKQQKEFIESGVHCYQRMLEYEKEAKQIVEKEVNKRQVRFIQNFELNASKCCKIADKIKLKEAQLETSKAADNVSDESGFLSMLYPPKNNEMPKINSPPPEAIKVQKPFTQLFQNSQKAQNAEEEDEFLLSVDNYVNPFYFDCPNNELSSNFLQSSINEFVNGGHIGQMSQSHTYQLESKLAMPTKKNTERTIESKKQKSPRRSLHQRTESGKAPLGGNAQYASEVNVKRFSLNQDRPFLKMTSGPLQQSPTMNLQRQILRERTSELNQRQSTRSKSKKPSAREMRSPQILNRSSKSLSQSNTSLSSKKRRLDVPQKFKNTIEDLQHDRCQVIDLSGAELGNEIILNICEYVRRSEKLKTLKLIMNKISDDVLEEVISACEGRVSSVNLSKNLLTERALTILESMEFINVKIITLSMNKINPRTAKGTIELLERRGIKLTV